MSEHNQPDRHPIDEIRTLVHRSFDEPLPESEIRKIERVLSTNAEARKWYAQMVQLHADLSTTCGAYEVCKYIRDEFPESQLTDTESTAEAMEDLGPSFGSSRGRWISNYAAAALILIGIGLGCGVTLFASNMLRMTRTYLPVPWEWTVGNEVIAKVESTMDAQWQSSQTPKTLPTCGLRVGQEIRLSEGTMTLSFRSGAEVMLQGPLVFEVRSETGGKLYSGRLAATVPSDIKAFHIETRNGRFQMGPGKFGVEVEENGGIHSSELHVFAGTAPAVESALFVSNVEEKTSIRSGEAMSFDDRGVAHRIALASLDEYPSTERFSTQESFEGNVIFLGNLFDDSKAVSLTEAVLTDKYQAAGETIDLGIAAVHDGGLDIDVSLAEDGVLFNLLNVGGGGPAVNGLPSNDTYRSISPIPIRTTGENFGTAGPLPKVEEGIGISANELLTFDLNEIRAAGQLGKRTMRFQVDRAGINDREDPLQDSRKTAGANFIVIVSTEDQVIAGYVNGEHFDIVDHGGVFSFNLEDASLPPELRYDGRFVSFDVPLPADARFLTLATTMNDVEHHDHCVFSGARLELLPPVEQTVTHIRDTE